MNPQEIYKSRLMGVDDAVKLLKSGDRLILGHAIGEPTTFTKRMAELGPELGLKGIEVNHEVYMGGGEYMQPEMEGVFRNNSMFVGGPARTAIKEKRADFTPGFFHEYPKMIREGYLHPDVFAAQCTPPDKFGYVNPAFPATMRWPRSRLRTPSSWKSTTRCRRPTAPPLYTSPKSTRSLNPATR